MREVIVSAVEKLFMGFSFIFRLIILIKRWLISWLIFYKIPSHRSRHEECIPLTSWVLRKLMEKKIENRMKIQLINKKLEHT